MTISEDCAGPKLLARGVTEKFCLHYMTGFQTKESTTIKTSSHTAKEENITQHLPSQSGNQNTYSFPAHLFEDANDDVQNIGCQC